MKERPILFSGEMVRAILAGTKTQTRRAVKPQPRQGTTLVDYNTADQAFVPWNWSMGGSYAGGERTGAPILCPFGQPGDRLWVRETWSTMGLGMYPNPRCWYRADFGDYDDPARDNLLHERGCTRNRADCWACVAEREGKFRWRPSIHMPRWASRLTLKATGVRVERLRDISEEDARAEGVTAAPFCKAGRPAGQEHVEAFEGLWRSINGAESWDLNPWVWVVSFKHVETEAAR